MKNFITTIILSLGITFGAFAQDQKPKDDKKTKTVNERSNSSLKENRKFGKERALEVQGQNESRNTQKPVPNIKEEKTERNKDGEDKTIKSEKTKKNKGLKGENKSDHKVKKNKKVKKEKTKDLDEEKNSDKNKE